MIEHSYVCNICHHRMRTDAARRWIDGVVIHTSGPPGNPTEKMVFDSYPNGGSVHICSRCFVSLKKAIESTALETITMHVQERDL